MSGLGLTPRTALYVGIAGLVAGALGVGAILIFRVTPDATFFTVMGAAVGILSLVVETRSIPTGKSEISEPVAYR